ncbi:C45 family peptidase [Arthrobacter sp. UYEF3]|uniref:C45 family peptidase n=1 Tax=Arthrobacter sp. UYEF3 TaxID=1756365 RepID=UPI003396181A
MDAKVEEKSIAGLRWLVIKGERTAVFRQLGRHAAEDVHAVQRSLPEREGLQQWAASAVGRQRLEALVAATAEHHTRELSELEAMAQGAAIDYEELLLANFRGDIGTHDGTGCTDLAWRRDHSFIAHNEDGAPALNGRLMFVTLLIDGDVPVTAQWYPGFVPANAFSANAHGLVWGINHVQVVNPANATGRHFVARALQHRTSVADAIAYLKGHPTAGGFAYSMGDRATGRIAVVEAAAGRTSVVEPGTDAPLQWHTNHLRNLPREIDGGSATAAGSATQQLGLYSESVDRGRVLDQLPLPETEPELDWFVNMLTAKCLPDGVFRTASAPDPLMTLCTVAVDLSDGSAMLRGADGETEAIKLEQLVGVSN